jgi:hypothetical protein
VFGHAGMIEFRLSNQRIPNQCAQHDILVGSRNELEIVFVSEFFKFHFLLILFGVRFLADNLGPQFKDNFSILNSGKEKPYFK